MYEDDNLSQEELDNEDNTQANKYLTFRIDKEDYAIQIKSVIEIVGIQNITSVPNIKNFIKGIINLRGNIIPVVDVHLRFGIPTAEYDDKTCIIVVSENNMSIGLIVDEVAEVMYIPEADISEAPQTNKGTHSKFIEGIGKLGEQIKIILNIHKLLFDEEFTA